MGTRQSHNYRKNGMILIAMMHFLAQNVSDNIYAIYLFFVYAYFHSSLPLQVIKTYRPDLAAEARFSKMQTLISPVMQVGRNTRFLRTQRQVSTSSTCV